MRAAVFTIFNMLVFASCYPAAVQKDSDSCLVMSPEKQKQIKFLEKELSEFLQKLEKQIGDIMITDILLSIDKNSAEEAKKDINFEVSVNDCGDVSAKTNANNKVIYFEEFNDTTGDSEDYLEDHEDSEEFDSENRDDVGSVESKRSSDDENLSNEVESNNENNGDEVTEEVEENDRVDNKENDSTAHTVQSEITQKKDVVEQSTPETGAKPSPEPHVQVMILKMNDQEAKMVRDVESIRGSKPFLLLNYKTGGREIKFL